MNAMNKHLVFVYGTLREGGVRAMPQLFPAAKLIGQATVCGRIYDLGDYPCLAPDQAGPAVTGEVYEIDDEILGELDEIEASADYGRQQVPVSLSDVSLSCWIYAPEAQSFPEERLIASGDWITYALMKTDG